MVLVEQAAAQAEQVPDLAVVALVQVELAVVLVEPVAVLVEQVPDLVAVALVLAEPAAAQAELAVAQAQVVVLAELVVVLVEQAAAQAQVVVLVDQVPALVEQVVAQDPVAGQAPQQQTTLRAGKKYECMVRERETGGPLFFYAKTFDKSTFF